MVESYIPAGYQVDIGLEVHAEMQTASKMFCGCPVVDFTLSAPNIAVCPVCAGLPGTLPVVNESAVEFALRVALALDCQIARTSIFARKNYFYPDLPKGYQISQYEFPLAQHGTLPVMTSAGSQQIRIRRVHLEEDTGKLTHVQDASGEYSLVDLNRAGVTLLEIVSEPDMHDVETVRAYATNLRQLLRSLGVNSGDMEKGVIRFEANVSVRKLDAVVLGTRTEIKNLNSFRALERSIIYEIQRQTALLDAGGSVSQETLGWDAVNNITFSQRSKEEAHDYRYFPEPDLPPLVVTDAWIERVAASLPERPFDRLQRFIKQYQLNATDAALLAEDKDVADYFEALLEVGSLDPKLAANWVMGDLFAQMKVFNQSITAISITPPRLAELIHFVSQSAINLNTGKSVLQEMFKSSRSAAEIIAAQGLTQISDAGLIEKTVQQVLETHPDEVRAFLAGKETLSQWFFGQVMRQLGGKADPKIVRAALEKQLHALGLSPHG